MPEPLVSPLKTKRGNQSGFTLLELLVAMVLVSMVTLVVAIALRLSIESWEGGVEEGEDIQLWVAIPSLMTKQLDSLTRIDPFEKTGGKQQLPFCGQKHALSFFTAYAPQGSPLQGLLKITYLFKEEEKTLYLFEQVITREEDLNDEYDPLSDKWGNSFKPMSQVPGISGFDLTYTGQNIQDPQEADDWKEIWKCTSKSLPTGLGLKLRIGTGQNAHARSLYFRLGGIGP
ncbi:MAG: type II secretion system protein [Deltaproteobacteria bacterium]|nr:type II secretion system protein [Deltaproteobacteria bacterium]MBW2142845.1 type II secretion system protein [Deltaproteobacteria bacterium]